MKARSLDDSSLRKQKGWIGNPGILIPLDSHRGQQDAERLLDKTAPPAVYMLNKRCLCEGLGGLLRSLSGQVSSKNIWPLAEMLEPA